MARRKQEEKPALKVVGNEESVPAVKPSKDDLPQRKQPIMSFDAWWVLIQRKLNLSAHMKEALFKHFKVRGFLKNKQYDEGLKDFGFKL